MPLPHGRFIYEVISGRIKFGPKFYLPGERLGLTVEQALSFGKTGQLKLIKVKPGTGKTLRKVAPGETLLRMPEREIKRIPFQVIKEMAWKEFGLPLEGRRLTNKILRTVMEYKNGVLRACRHAKTDHRNNLDQPVK